MTRFVAAVALAALTHGGAANPAAAPLLNIDVVAIDGKGAPVTDLKPDELEVWINDRRIPIQTVTFVTPREGATGRTLVLLLDDMVAHPVSTPRIKEAARQLVKRLPAGDRMAIVSLNGDMMKSTDDRASLLKAIDGYHSRSTPMRIEDIGYHVMKTVAMLSRQMTEAFDGRKAIVAIGTGWMFDMPVPPPTGTRDLRPVWVEAMRAAAAARVSLYVIDPAGVGSRVISGGDSGFARETGGYAFTNTNDVNGAIGRILSEIQTYYVLSVEDPPIGRKADLREVEIKVSRRGVTARARKGIGPAV